MSGYILTFKFFVHITQTDVRERSFFQDQQPSQDRKSRDHQSNAENLRSAYYSYAFAGLCVCPVTFYQWWANVN